MNHFNKKAGVGSNTSQNQDVLLAEKIAQLPLESQEYLVN